MVDPSWKRFGPRRESLSADGTKTITHKASGDGSTGGWEFVVGADGRLMSARAEVDGDTVHLYEYAGWGTRMGWEVPGTVTYTFQDRESGEAIFTESRRLETLEPLPAGFDWDPWRLHVAANPELAGRREPE